MIITIVNSTIVIVISHVMLISYDMPWRRPYRFSMLIHVYLSLSLSIYIYIYTYVCVYIYIYIIHLI